MGSSKIVAMKEPAETEGHVPVSLIYDTDTTGLAVAPPLPSAPRRFDVMRSIAAGNGLYVLSDAAEPGKNGGMFRLEKASSTLRDKQWSWRSIPSPPLPFGRHDTVMSTAVLHRDQEQANNNNRRRATIFVSVVRCNVTSCHDTGSYHTYSYDDPEDQEGEWRHIGEWALPFRGHAHYDAELDAWIGFHMADDGRLNNDGFLCSCDVVASGTPAPDWKLGAEQLFQPPWIKNVELVYMGDSNYCLVEFEPFRRRSRRCAGGGNRSAFRLATFRLKYGKKGELVVTARRPDRNYVFSRYDQKFVPHALLDVVEARKGML